MAHPKDRIGQRDGAPGRTTTGRRLGKEYENVIAPASILVVGDPRDIEPLLRDHRTKKVLGEHVKIRSASERAVVITEFSERRFWDDAERAVFQLSAFNPDLAFAAVPLVRDMPAGIPLRAYENVDDIRADRDYVEDLEDVLCLRTAYPGSRLEEERMRRVHRVSELQDAC